MLAERIAERFSGWDLSAEESDYLRYHVRRYAVLTERVERLRPRRLLDVGAGFQTVLFRDLFGDDAVDSIGLWEPRFSPSRREDAHRTFDLDDLDRPGEAPELGRYDVVVAAEVLEHLCRTPAAVLRFLAGALSRGGHLVVQTPNAAAAHKRLRVLLGRPAIGAMPETRRGAAHVREYTLGQVIGAGAEAGLALVDAATENYFGPRRPLADRLLPPGLRLGLTVTFRRP